MIATTVLTILTLTAGGWQEARQAPVVHVLRIQVGPSGEESGGSFVFTEERSTLSRSSDREVIASFLWDGTPGPHRLVATWRSPDGTLSSSSTIEYVAKDRRFGASWRLSLTPATPLGPWSIEATVDGQPAGRSTFEIVDEAVASVPVKRPLSQSELYTRLSSLAVMLQPVLSNGKRLEPYAGTLGSDGRVYTTVASLDGNDGLQARRLDGGWQEVTNVLAWNRLEDWAVLSSSYDGGDTPLPIASGADAGVGARCYTVETSDAGALVLAEGVITGLAGGASPGAQLLATFHTVHGTPGAPVINEFGEIVGIIGGTGVSGATRLIDVLRFRFDMKATPVVPFSSLHGRGDVSPIALTELRSRGELVSPVIGEAHVLSGGFATGIAREPTVIPVDQRQTFSPGEPRMIVFLTWNPKERLRGMAHLRLYDAQNRLVLQSKPQKADLRKDRATFAYWELGVPGERGVYRADILLDERTMWRGFVRIR